MSLDNAHALWLYPILAVLHIVIYFAIVACSRRKEAHLDSGGCCCACAYGKNCLKDYDDAIPNVDAELGTSYSGPSL